MGGCSAAASSPCHGLKLGLRAPGSLTVAPTTGDRSGSGTWEAHSQVLLGLQSLCVPLAAGVSILWWYLAV